MSEKAGDELLTRIIQDHEAPSYHVIEYVRRGIRDIENELLAAPRVSVAAARWIESLHEDGNGFVWITKAELRAALGVEPT